MSIYFTTDPTGSRRGTIDTLGNLDKGVGILLLLLSRIPVRTTYSWGTLLRTFREVGSEPCILRESLKIGKNKTSNNQNRSGSSHFCLYSTTNGHVRTQGGDLNFEGRWIKDLTSNFLRYLILPVERWWNPNKLKSSMMNVEKSPSALEE